MIAKVCQKGTDREYPSRALYDFLNKDLFDKAAGLETIMVGTCWAPHRKFDANMITMDLHLCHHCYECGCDDVHQFWIRAKFAEPIGTEISNTQ